jgi:hypothetical protein
MNKKKVMENLDKHFGGPTGILIHQIMHLSMTEQLCDITFRKTKPAIDVKIDPKIALALMYGAGAKKMQEILSNIRLSNGVTTSLKEIWVVFPMPGKGFTEDELNEVDLALGEDKWGPNGETVREMIRNVYHCKSKEEEEKFLRRYLAS